MEDSNIKKELDQLRPFLNQNQARKEANLPADYFDSLRQNIMAQTIDKQLIRPKRKRLHHYWKLAATFALVMGIALSFYTFLGQNKIDTTDTFDDLTTTEILDYIEENIS